MRRRAKEGEVAENRELVELRRRQIIKHGSYRRGAGHRIKVEGGKEVECKAKVAGR